jgi:hypothetical protein
MEMGIACQIRSLVPNFHDIPIWEPCHESLESNGPQIWTYTFQVFAARIASRLASRWLDLFKYVSTSPLVSYLSISSCNLVHSSFNSAIICLKNLSLAAVNVQFLGDYIPCRCWRTTPCLYGHLPGSEKILPKHLRTTRSTLLSHLHSEYSHTVPHPKFSLHVSQNRTFAEIL